DCGRAPGSGCGECEPCNKIERGLHPDYLVVLPDGAFIKIAQVRQVTARAAYRPHEGRVRVVVLDPADAMNLEAANALLKTLEEPPADTHFVLCSAAPERLPVTVRSRCQRVRFVPLAAAQVAAYLARERGLAAAQAQVVAALAAGSLARALAPCEGEAPTRRPADARRIEQAVRGRTIREGIGAAAQLKAANDTLPP